MVREFSHRLAEAEAREQVRSKTAIVLLVAAAEAVVVTADLVATAEVLEQLALPAINPAVAVAVAAQAQALPAAQERLGK